MESPMTPSRCGDVVRGLLRDESKALLQALFRQFDVVVAEDAAAPSVPPTTPSAAAVAESSRTDGSSATATSPSRAGEGTSRAGSRKTLVVQCRSCDEEDVPPDGSGLPAPAPSRAFFSAPPPHVVLCVNELGSPEEIEEALLHELTHAVDHETLGLKLGRCVDLACSEVRAAFAAECRDHSIGWLRRSCVKNRAALATRMVFRAHGQDCVAEVFRRCYDSPPTANPLQPRAEGDR